MEGLDVSYYQGVIDWAQVKSANKAFAIARISDGLTYVDTQFGRNWAALREVGLVRGAYQYFEPAQDAAAQADMVVAAVGKLGPGDLPVQLDIEATGGQSSSTIVSQMQSWIDRVTEGTGKRPFIYTAKYFWNDHVASTQFESFPLWVANYDVTCPDLPDAWAGWTLWQYSDRGAVPGIGGDVDLDRFQGTLEDLDRASGRAPAYAAQYVSQSFPLASQGMTMTTNQSVAAYVELKNIGGRAWDGNTLLATSHPRDRSSAFVAADWISPTRLARVKGTVQPGESFRFEFTLRAPSTIGVYAEYFNLLQDGVGWFSDAGQGGPPDDQLQDLVTVVADTRQAERDSDGKGDATAVLALQDAGEAGPARLGGRAASAEDGAAEAAAPGQATTKSGGATTEGADPRSAAADGGSDEAASLDGGAGEGAGPSADAPHRERDAVDAGPWPDAGAADSGLIQANVAAAGEDGGCGCEVASRRPSVAAYATLMALLAYRRRRSAAVR